MKPLEQRENRRHGRGPARIAVLDLEASLTLDEPIVVSELAAASNRNDRWQVALNGTDLGSVTLDFLADSGIRERDTLTAQRAGEVIAAVNRTTVLDKALDLLAVRARSSRDLGSRLKRAGARPGDVSWVLARLEAQGFLDDSTYAKQVARTRVLAGGVSRRRVVTALRRKGIAADVAEAAIDATLADVELDEYGAALAAAQKRIRALSSLDSQKRRQRLYAFLARRGYEADVVRKVLAEVLG